VASADFTSRIVYTPSELNREVRLLLEAGFQVLWIEGEISNLARPASGHICFSLKAVLGSALASMQPPKTPPSRQKNKLIMRAH